MDKVLKTAQAGTLESSDIVVTVAPCDGDGVNLELESIVYEQYGEVIKKLIYAILREHGVKGVHIKAVDRGALDCTIKARVLCALMRAGAINSEEVAL